MSRSVSHPAKVTAALLLAAVAGLMASAGPSPSPDKTKPEPPAFKVPAVFDKDAPEGVADLRAIESHVKAVLKKVMPAVVGIRMNSGAGSGVVISADGYVLTAGHVSGPKDRECVLLFPDGRRVKGVTLGRDGKMDSGLIKITEKGKWPHVGMADAAALKRGTWTVAVGHPGGFKPGRSPVVRLGRVLRAEKNGIVTDNTLVGGDSGGPLFDMQGNVVGIHSRIGRGIAENVHVPIAAYRADWDRLVKEEWNLGGPFARGGRRPAQAYLGVVFDGDTTDLKVTEVRKDSPADKAGFQVGDVLLSIDGTNLADRDGLHAFLSRKRADDEVAVVVRREKGTATLKVKLGRRPRE